MVDPWLQGIGATMSMRPPGTDGEFTNRTYGGKGARDQHGKFSTNHGYTYDPRHDKIAVSDCANSRVEYSDFDRGSQMCSLTNSPLI